MFRVGTGWDIHELIPFENGNLIIGGVKINSKVIPLAHSDGDALIHAIIDALLGATALGDIGKFFPDTDKKYENINSLFLLKQIREIILTHFPDFKIINIDSTVILQKPKLSPYIEKIRDKISDSLQINKNAVSVKAKTAEKLLGKLGLGQAVEAQVYVLISI